MSTFLERKPLSLDIAVVAGYARRPGAACSIVPSGVPQTVLLSGELDAETAVVGRRQLVRALEAGKGPLLVDCSAVQFIDAAWLGVLVSTARYGRKLGRRVTVSAPGGCVARLLALIGLDWLASAND